MGTDMETGKSIIENDIEKYTAFIESLKIKLYRCLPDQEAEIEVLIHKHEDVLLALQDLKSEIYFQKNT